MRGLCPGQGRDSLPITRVRTGAYGRYLVPPRYRLPISGCSLPRGQGHPNIGVGDAGCIPFAVAICKYAIMGGPALKVSYSAAGLRGGAQLGPSNEWLLLYIIMIAKLRALR